MTTNVVEMNAARKEPILGDRLAVLLEDGGLTRSQAEEVRAELEKVGFHRFRRHRGRELLPALDTSTVDRLVLTTEQRIDTPEHQRTTQTRLYLRHAWRVSGNAG